MLDFSRRFSDLAVMQGPVPQPDVGWLDYGSMGLLAIVLAAIFFLLRGYLASVTKWMTESSQFTQSLVTKSMDSMDRLVAENQRVMSEHTLAQAEATAAMREVKESMNNSRLTLSKEHEDTRETLSKEHDTLRVEHQRIIGGLKGGLRRESNS